MNDLNAIVEIYNAIILEGGFTADLTGYTVEEKTQWFETCLEKPYGIRVFIVNGTIAGYLYLSPWRKGRASLDSVAEVSYYLNVEFRGNGFGKLLLQECIEIAKANGLKTLLAILLDTNEVSIELLKKEGFQKAGHFPQVADLGDRIVGQDLMAMRL